MSTSRTPIDLGFAEFAAQLVAELQEAVSVAHDEQEARRRGIAERAAMGVPQFARAFVTNAEVDAELARLFPARGSKGTAIATGRSYRAASTKFAEAPPIEKRLQIKLGARELRKRGGRLAFTARGVAKVREAMRLRLAEARLKALRQTVAQGLPNVVVDSGHVTVKLSFDLVDLDQLGARSATIAPLKPLLKKTANRNRLSRLRLIVRQVNEHTTPSEPSAASGIGELDLTFKTT